MDFRRYRYGLWLLALLLAGFIGLNGLAYRHAYAMLHYTTGGARTEKPEALNVFAKTRVLFTGVNLPRPQSDLPPSALAPDAQALTIDAPDGVKLSAWYAKRRNFAPLVIFFHGYGTDKTRLLPEARAILAMGASVLLVDFRGSGGSSENYATLGLREADDVAAAVRYARNHLPQGAPEIILYGQSMGSAAILRAVQECKVRPAGVILESVFDSLLGTVRNRFDAMGVPAFPAAELLVFWGGRQFDFNGFAHNPVEYARSLTCAALFLHGADDPRATLAEGRRVFTAAACWQKSFVVFENTGHDSYFLKHPDQWRAAVHPFINQFLLPDQIITGDVP